MSERHSYHPDLVEVAQGRPLSVVDQDAGAGQLQIDLGLRFPIHAIAVGSPAGGVSLSGEGAVSVSDDGQTWTFPETASSPEWRIGAVKNPDPAGTGELGPLHPRPGPAGANGG